MRKRQKDQLKTASLLVNYILFLALAVYTVAALTRHYANSPASTPAHLTHLQPVPSGKVLGTATPAGSAAAQSGTVVGGGKKVGLKAVQDQIADTCRKAYQRHQKVAIERGVSEGVFVSTCFSDLNGLAQKESGHNPNAYGDHGIGEGSFGIVQINQHYHPGTKDCALDVGCATSYAIDRLVRYGWPTYRSRAIQCWNGCTADNGYADAVKRYALNYK